jgi:hypothetical protein
MLTVMRVAAGCRTLAPLVLAILATVTVTNLGSPPAAAQEDDAAHELAERYAPFVRLQEDSTNCDEGEQFQPTDVEAVLGDQQVALRGPWADADLVAVSPEGELLGRGFPGHALDFPGNPLRPGCTYADWSARINAAFEPTVYAYVTDDPTRPGQLALQYWFFYVFNDYNNTHEGDWESIRLIFDVGTAEEALRTDPVAVGYSQHGGGERALWDNDKLTIVDGTHPVVYPAGGSHANHFESKLYLGRGSEGLGCDDTTRPREGFFPAVAFVPGSPEETVAAFPWLAFEGRWGERQESFFNGPTGPNLKASWTEPIRDAEESWRDTSATVPAGSLFGPDATQVFCGAVATGSNLVRQALDNLWVLALIVLVVVVLVWFAATRTRWSPADPLPLRARRDWGQCIRASIRVFADRPTLFVVFGLALIPLSLSTGVLAGMEAATPTNADLDAPAEDAPNWVGIIALLLSIGTIVMHFAMTAAVAGVLGRIGDGQPVSRIGALKEVARRWRPLLGVTARMTLILLALTLLVFTIPLAVYYAVSRAYAIPAVMIEHRSARDALRRSRRLVHDDWLRNAVALLIVGGVGIAVGPVVGIVLLLATDVDPYLINLASSLIYAAALPFIALAVTYLFFDQTTEATPSEENDAEVATANPG